MPPTFKKPLEYDPSLAEKTLARAFHRGDAAEAKKKHMLAELGLADEEGIDVDEDVGDDDLEEDEQPIFTDNLTMTINKQSNANGQLPVYGYRDVFSKEYQRHRQQLIDVKGYDKFLQDLLKRSSEILQLLRCERNLQDPSSVEIISELEHEMQALHEENKSLEQQVHNLSSSPHGHDKATVQVDNLQAELDSLQGQVVDMEATLRARDASIKTLQAQLQQASSGGGAAAAAERHAANGHSVASLTAQVEQLQAAMQKKEALLSAALEQVGDLQASGARPSALVSEEGAAQLQAALAQRDELQEWVAALESQLRDAEAQAAKQELDFETKLKELQDSTNADHTSKLQQHVWAVQEAAVKRQEELQAELKQKEVIIMQLRAAQADAQKQVDALNSKVKQATSAAAAQVKDKLDSVCKQVDDLHALREGVLAELLSMQNDMFSDKVLSQMGRMVRDKELQAIRKASSEAKAQIEAYEKRAVAAEEQAAFVKSQCEETLRIRELELQGMAQHFKDKWKAEFDKRRKLHNLVLELKGSIRVLCRMRPFLPKEKEAGPGEEAPVRVTSEETMRIISERAEKDFEFDRVFNTSEGQDTVFDEVSALVTSVLDGYNVSIMAYGQTGSGKTFTMEGPEDNPGVNSRALRELFRIIDERADDFTYKLSCSTLEIYNEQIFDLLSGGKDQDDKLDVKQGAEGMYIPGLKVEEVESLEGVLGVIRKGKQNRSTFATNMNEHSSRSHLVLTVYAVAKSKATGAVMRGKLHLIDLAGSERISRTGAQGDRLKEAQNINKSLSALGDVIQALQQKNAHIPYRNSKLTRLLEDSLGGNAKCVLVCNVSPAAENVGETKCSLEFAARARKVELGRAKQNVDSSSSSSSAAAAKGPARASPTGTPPESISRNSSTGNVSGIRKPSK